MNNHKINYKSWLGAVLPISRKVLLLTICIALASQLSSQSSILEGLCGTDELNIGDYPGLVSIEQSYNRSNSATYVIPTVIHIVHNNGVENIADDQIISALNQVNARLNGQLGGTDSEIELRLATMDPNGDCTNGINRILTPIPDAILGSGCSNDCGLDKDELADLAYWNNDQYLNIWIVRSILNCSDCSVFNIGGYSNYPTTTGVDGLVINHDKFGTIGTAEDVELKQVFAHELGHYLFLYHPWGPGGEFPCDFCGDPTDCANTGDLICDTAPCSGARGGTINNCDSDPSGCPDVCTDYDWPSPLFYPHDNYMTNNRTCTYRFTPDQIERMQWALETYREILWSDINLTQVSNYNLSVSILPEPLALCEGLSFDFIDIEVDGGSGNYSYNWSNGEITEDLINVDPGTYVLQIIDESSTACSDQLIETIVLPEISLSAQITEPDCSNTDLPIIDLTIENEISTSSIEWTGPYEFTSNDEDLIDVPGHNWQTYDVEVSTIDGYGNTCLLSGSYEFQQYNQFHVFGDVTIDECLSITSDIMFGGLQMYEYTYQWFNSSGILISTSENISNVIPDEYTLVVTNQFGCSRSRTFEIEPTEITSDFLPEGMCMSDSPVELSQFMILGNNETVNSFTGPGVLGNSFDPSLAGIGLHTIVVEIEKEGCTCWISAVIGVSDFSVDVLSTNTCAVAETGTAQAIVTGASGELTYSWPNGATSDNLAVELGAGTYNVIVSDEIGCSVTSNDFIIDTDPVTDPVPLNISTDDNWTGQTRQFLGNLTIDDGATLTLSGCYLEFAPGTGIIVEAGAELYIDEFTTITSFACTDQLWRGVEVRGLTQQNQSTSGGHQGRLTMYDSEILRAELGITNHHRDNIIYNGVGTTGGVIRLDRCTIEDCLTAVYMAPYRNWYGSNLHSESSRFTETTFRWTPDRPLTDPQSLEPMIRLEEMHDIYIKGCTMENSNTDILKTPTWMGNRAAIYASRYTSLHMIDECNAQYLPCPENLTVHNSVSGFRYGLVQQGGRADVRNTQWNNYRSVYALHTKGDRYTGNDFGVLPTELFDWPNYEPDPYNEQWRTHFGLYLDRSNAYWVENNYFDMVIDQADSDFDPQTGLFVRGSGGSPEQVYGNTFEKAGYGAISYDDNRGMSMTEGLHFECNHFLSNRFGLNITTTNELQQEVPGWGVPWQGVAPTLFEDGTSAGNYFEGQGGYDVRNDGNVDLIYYYWNDADTPQGEDLNETGNMEKENLSVDPRSCPSGYHEGIAVKSNRATLAHSTATSLRAQLDGMIDGGQTEDLLSEVNLTQYGEALELYYELMAKSPNLSEEVMLLTIQKEAELPPVLLTLILESNPHAAKSKAVEKKLDERSMPLDEYQRYMIDQGKYLLSNKERMESMLAKQLMVYASSLNQAIQLALDDESITDKLSYVASLVAGMEDLTQRYLRIELHLAHGDVAGAQSLLNSIPDDIDLTDRKDQEYQDYQDCYGIAIALIGSGGEALSTTDEALLVQIADKHSTRASGLAQVLLMQYRKALYDEKLVDPEDVQKNARTYDGKKPKFSGVPSVRVYPNPADDHIALEFRNWTNQARVVISDVSGKIVMDEIVNSDKIAHLVDVSSLSEGTYSMFLQSLDGAFSDQKQIEIIR